MLLSALVAAAEDFECRENTQIKGNEYDLTSLNAARSASRERNTPPTTMVDSIRFNLCADLESSDLPEQDQCPGGTRACLTKTNKREGEQDRIIAVIPLATTGTASPEYSALTGSDGFTVLLHGKAYPENGTNQNFNITLVCSQEASDPTFVDYNNGLGSVKWSTPAACPKKKGDPPPTDKPDETHEPSSPPGSGIGWFFLLLFLVLAAYFLIGIYHNYTNYGASGWDLIPHRDFWREVPYLLRDLGYHLVTALRGGPSRGGYQSV